MSASARSLISRVYAFENQGVEIDMASFTITPKTHFSNFCFLSYNANRRASEGSGFPIVFVLPLYLILSRYMGLWILLSIRERSYQRMSKGLIKH